MSTFKFKIGDHGLREKRGHCTGCSAVQAIITVQAENEAEAIKKANKKFSSFSNVGWESGDGLSISFTVKTKITKRQLVTG